LVFVHGWKNNAAFGNSNIATFQAALQKLSEVELALCQKENRQPRKVVGIYAGWRGLSESIEPFKELSFWGRKAAAQRVGGYGAMTELLMDLESLQKASNDSRPTNLPPSKLVIVGHSFGADAVYNAISQIVTERFVDTIKQEKGQLLKPLGDQVILLNPAFEAARLYDLKQLARSVETYSPEQRPVVSILTSDGDWATHYVFPVGQTIGTVFQSHRSGLQKSANHEAVGWFEPFVTHELHYAPRAAHAPSSGHPPDAMVGKLMLRSPDKLPGAAENILAQRQKWRAESAPEEINYFGDCVLISNGNYRPHDPILVISVDKQIMKDHNDIGNTVLLNFLQEYIPFCENDTSVAVGGVK